MDELELVKEILITAGHTAGYSVSSNLEAIAKAKLRFFGVGDCRRCPCQRANEKAFCVSEECANTINKEGVCHCHLFERVK